MKTQNIRFGVVLRIAFMVSIFWLLTVLGVVIVDAQRSDSQQESVTLAEHERLKAEVELADAQQLQLIAVQRQRVDDLEKIIVANTIRLSAVETTIHFSEGIALSFGTIIALLNGWSILAHRKLEARMNPDGPPS